MPIHISKSTQAFNIALERVGVPKDSEIYGLIKEFSSKGEKQYDPNHQHENVWLIYSVDYMGVWRGIAIRIDDSVAVFVNPGHRRKGVGSRLLMSVKTTAEPGTQLKTWSPITSEYELPFWSKANIHTC